MLNKTNDNCRSLNNNLIVWGVSAYLGRTLKMFKANGIEPVCLTDNDREKWGYKYFGVECERPVDAIKKYPGAVFYIVPNDVSNISAQLVDEFGISPECILNSADLGELDLENAEIIRLDYQFIPEVNDKRCEIDKFMELVEEIKPEFVCISHDLQYEKLPQETYFAAKRLIRRLKNENIVFEIQSNLIKDNLYPKPRKTPKAFVFTCAYNAEKTIARTIESVLNQSFEDFEYYIVNNGSTDSTGNIILDYAAHDARVYMIQINHNDLRNHKSICRVLSRSSGAKYFTRLDADDVMHKDFLETMINYADENDCDIVACGYNKIDASTGALLAAKQSGEKFVVSGDKFRDDFVKYRGYTIYIWAKLINIDFYNRLIAKIQNNQHEQIYYTTDSDGAMKLIKQTNRFGVVGKPMIDYYIYKNALSFNLTENIYESHILLYKSTIAFIKSYGKLSAQNENFLHCIYLSIIDELAENIFKHQKITDNERYEILCSVLTNYYTREAFYFIAAPGFNKLAERKKWLDAFAEKIKSCGGENKDFSEFLPLIENLKQAEKYAKAQTVIFESEYEKILSEINSSVYIRQIEDIKNVSQNRPVILYGAGQAVGIVLVVCRKYGLNITALCDSNKTGIYENGGVSLPIISPKKLVENYANSSLIVTSWKFENEIRENLKTIGFDNNNIFSFWYPQRITPEIFKRDYYDGYKWAYVFYEDDKSKQLVLDKINNYLTSSPLKPNTVNETYYEDVINLGDEEVFLDGAYDEDIAKNIEIFTKKVSGKYKHIYVFKPENESSEELGKYLDEHSNIEIFDFGLGSKNDVKAFYYGGLLSSGFVSCKYYATNGTKFTDAEFKTEDKDVFSIDMLIKDGKIKHVPTFIKLDVEGCEIGTLKGATNLIRQYKPKLAICAYHQVSDIYAIPQTILNIRGDYKFILRQHDYGYYETVLYAY